MVYLRWLQVTTYSLAECLLLSELPDETIAGASGLNSSPNRTHINLSPVIVSYDMFTCRGFAAVFHTNLWKNKYAAKYSNSKANEI